MFQVFDCKFMWGAPTNQPTHGENSPNLAWEVYHMWPRSRLCWWYCSGSHHRAYVVEVKRTKTLWIKLQDTMRHLYCACCDICEISSLLLTSWDRSPSSCRPPTLLTCFSTVPLEHNNHDRLWSGLLFSGRMSYDALFVHLNLLCSACKKRHATVTRRKRVIHAFLCQAYIISCGMSSMMVHVSKLARQGDKVS